jgi:hypothetical protein
MPQATDRWISVDQAVLNDGVNSAFRPDQIGNAQAAWASNMTIRDGKPQSRDYNLVQRALLPKGLVQGAGYFSANNGQFILSIWGQLWRMLVTGNTVTIDQIPLSFVNSPDIPLVWMCETQGSFVVQDNQSAAIIYDGATARRADPTIPEVPIGAQMAFGNGRLAVAIDGNQVVVGNIAEDIFQSELQFTETTYLSGGGSFLFRYPVTALAFLPVNNTDTGYGSLIVFGTPYTDSLGLQITQRELWNQIPGFEQVLLPTIGAAGQDCVISVNQDLYWRDGNGNVWSLRAAQWDALSPGNSPISREVKRIVDYEIDTLVQYSGGIFFDNRILFMASPFYNQFGFASFKCIIGLDCAPLSTIRGKSPPAYDGIAEGLNFVKLFQGNPNGVNRAFTISTDDDGENRLWEIVPNNVTDVTVLSNGTGNETATVPIPVTTYFESRRFDFGLPGKAKRLMRLDIWPCELQGEVSITAYYRADNRSQWQFWDTLTVNAQMTNNPGQWVDLETQERGQVKSFTMPDGEDSIDERWLNTGFGFQVRIVWTGYLLMDRIKLWALPLTDTQYSDIASLPIGPIQNIVANNNITYSIPVGGLGSSYTDQNGNVYMDQFSIPYTNGP